MDYSQYLIRKEGRERMRWRESGRAEGKGQGLSWVDDIVITIISKDCNDTLHIVYVFLPNTYH